MHHDDRIRILERCVPSGGAWADLGCGDGAFTLALAQLVAHEDSCIHLVDRDPRALNAVTNELRSHWPRLQVRTYCADLGADVDLPPLDGALLAFTLQETREPARLLTAVRGWLRPGGRLVVIEQDGSPGAQVAWPCPWRRFEGLATGAGFAHVGLVEGVRSRVFPRAYFAVCDTPV